MRRIIFVVTLVIGMVCKARAQTGALAPALTAVSAPTAAQSQGRFDKVDAWLTDNVKEMGGRAILLVYKGGKVVYVKSVNDMSRRQKMVNKYIARRQGKEADLEDYTMQSRQPVASCSKWFSAALVMTFVDEGRLSLSDTVGKYLPVLSAHGKGGITVKQCLSHLTGIKEPPLKESIKEMRTVKSMDQAIAAIAEMPMEGQPGKVFHYSNAGLQIAGAILEKISGESFESLFAERISRPLGMKNTDFGKGPVALPAGGASSTPEDYMRFLVMILDKGMYKGARILSEKSVAEMQVNRISPDITIAYSPAETLGLSAGYGFGEWTMGSAVTSPGLFGSFPWVDPGAGYCAFLMTFYLKNEGRGERYSTLKKLVEEAL
ncbi:MAG TPA: serine hydrolase domain-containing protein [Puia sp.]|nr:serine hydrolase domain-containing protein [Puia sp.]